jgi:hypothetical protein
MYPFSMGQSFNYLSRVAQAHAKNSNSRQGQHHSASSIASLPSFGSSSSVTEWQNDQLRIENESPVVLTPSPRQGGHKHRHGHGSRTKKAQSNFKLDEDHPLRSILATVASNVNSRERTRSRHSSRHHQNHNHHHLSAVFEDTGDRSGEERSDEKDIIIQKIYITSPNQAEESER